MACSSDGEKIGEQERRKTRHFSLGSMSREEINSVIGINVNLKKEQIRKYLDKQHSKQPKKQGNSVNNENEDKTPVNIQDQTNIVEYVDDAFKPKKVVKRTPTKENTIEQKQKEPNTFKRNRSELSPENEINSKKRCSESQEKEIQIVDVKEDIILEMFNYLDIINNVTNMEDIPHNSQSSLREAHNNLHKLVTRLVFHYSSLEKANIILKNKAQNSGEFKQQGQCVQNHPKTYATAAHTGTSTTQQSISFNTRTPWTTPPNTTKKIETLVKISDITDAKTAIKKIKENITGKDTEGGFKNIFPLQNGSVIIQSHDKNQQNKLAKALHNINDVTVKDLGNTNPMIMITGIEKGYSEEEFVDELLIQNPEVNTLLPTEVKQHIKVITRKSCRNPIKENWILQAPPIVSKWFLKKEKINFDFLTVYIKEHIPLTICFKCNGFGHVAKYCKNKECCHKCGENHAAKDCMTMKLCCPNCSQLKYSDIEHSARNINCPTYQRKLQRTKARINYEEGENFC